MKYSGNTITNEQKAEENGERNIITDKMLNYYLGGDNTNAEAWEMLLDILNNHWPLDDAVANILEQQEDEEE